MRQLLIYPSLGEGDQDGGSVSEVAMRAAMMSFMEVEDVGGGLVELLQVFMDLAATTSSSTWPWPWGTWALSSGWAKETPLHIAAWWRSRANYLLDPTLQAPPPPTTQAPMPRRRLLRIGASSSNATKPQRCLVWPTKPRCLLLCPGVAPTSPRRSSKTRHHLLRPDAAPPRHGAASSKF
ncbi:hypothetical protein E2562_035355 [Oryza meyeriana var. granulata]|uniref:Uncharacterized protein n=1 Tax=Oryza meyeriana var. granulata TaxID=110450 RepID=A0A6G1BRI4_9ORYZ|nr:hypothetical protein E2562_035355 [Oryza meyeriana var. granulata]